MAKKEKPKAAAKGKEKKSAKGEKDLTPLEKARIARASGKGGKKKKAKKNVMVFKAPEGTKPFFIKTQIAYGKDGLFTDMKAVRIKGNAKNPDAKKVDLGLWDPDTLRKMAIRFAGASFVRNEAKRLPANTVANALFRVGVNREDQAIKVALKEVRVKNAAGKVKTLEKKDPMYRAHRKPVKFMAAAFTKIKDFPSAADLKALMKSQEE
jgi:hypothetical protein